jgi:hypothetical protein
MYLNQCGAFSIGSTCLFVLSNLIKILAEIKVPGKKWGAKLTNLLSGFSEIFPDVLKVIILYLRFCTYDFLLF